MLDKAVEIKTLKKVINETLTREEIMWKQRSGALWLESGDRNTKFFHATASQRRRRNKISGLLNDQRVWVEDQQGIDSIILDYFSAIFKTDNPLSFDKSLSAISTRVSEEMNRDLLAVFKVEEVRVTLQQMHPTKAPSPDGMSPIFFQKYWEIVGLDVIECMLSALNSSVLP